MGEISLEERIIDALIDGLEGPFEEQSEHYKRMFEMLAHYRSRLAYMERRKAEGKEP
jgi:hypothetical protein|tara:strand:- start:378 stop:548 length:171 start_codon:yes stop_codon:yes gene_type:complete